jgi:hypothetical protein
MPDVASRVGKFAAQNRIGRTQLRFARRCGALAVQWMLARPTMTGFESADLAARDASIAFSVNQQ